MQKFDFKTETKQNLKKHVEGVHEGKKHDCKYCDKTYTQKEKLDSHMKLHTGIGLKECNNCDFKAENNQILKQHKKSHHEKNGKFVCRSIVLPLTKVSKSIIEEKVGYHQFWKDDFFSQMKEYQLMNYKRYWYNFCMKSGHNQQNTPTEEIFVEFFQKEKYLGCSDKARWRKYMFLKRIVFHLYGLKLQKFTKLRDWELFKTKEKGDCRSIVSKSVIEEKVGHHQFWKDDFFSRMKEYQLRNYKRYWYNFCMKSGHNQQNTPTEEIFVEFFNKEKDLGCSDKAQWRKYMFLKRIVSHLYDLKLQKYTKLRAIALFKTKLRKKEK